MKNRGTPLARLDRAAQAAKTAWAAREEEKSVARLAEIATWRPGGRNFDGRILDSIADLPRAEMDRRLIVMSQEYVYHYELKYGPVVPCPLPCRLDEVSPWGLGPIPLADMAAMAKTILLQEGLI